MNGVLESLRRLSLVQTHIHGLAISRRQDPSVLRVTSCRTECQDTTRLKREKATVSVACLPGGSAPSSVLGTKSPIPVAPALESCCHELVLVGTFAHPEPTSASSLRGTRVPAACLCAVVKGRIWLDTSWPRHLPPPVLSPVHPCPVSSSLFFGEKAFGSCGREHLAHCTRKREARRPTGLAVTG